LAALFPIGRLANAVTAASGSMIPSLPLAKEIPLTGVLRREHRAPVVVEET
jgi:hypothetical protein